MAKTLVNLKTSSFSTALKAELRSTKKSLTPGLKKKFAKFRPQIRSRHPSHKILRKDLPLLPFRSVIRLGSTTKLPDTIANGGKRVEINTVDAILNSASKKRMKTCFDEAGVKTAPWLPYSSRITPTERGISVSNTTLEYPIVAKLDFGSRGRGMQLIKSLEEYNNFLRKASSNLSSYIFEKFINYTKEYRLHVTKDGCFYACRKMIKEDTPQKDRWFRNDSNCVWILESNTMFDRPVNWDNIINECKKALKSVGLDFCACDVRVQSRLDSRSRVRVLPEYFIVEVNSAPSFGEETAKRYLSKLPELLRQKYETNSSNRTA